MKQKPFCQKFYIFLTVFSICVLLISAAIFFFVFYSYERCSISVEQNVSKNENCVLPANNERVLQVDYHIQTLAAEYVDQPFIHPKLPKWEREKSNHTPSGPKMVSVREMAAITLPIRIGMSHPCGCNQGQGLLAVVFVFCQVKDFSRRSAIRATYGSELKAHPQTEIYFVVSRVANASLEADILAESCQYDDILQFDFTDTYYNLTLKSLAVLRWSSLYCSQAKFIFKMDDDGIIRVQPFVEHLRAFSAETIYGRNLQNDSVLRKGKWSIDRWYYPHAVYPTFHPGPYLIPSNVTISMYEALVSAPTDETIPALPFDDVYTTGILAEKLSIPRAKFPGLEILNDRPTGNDRDNIEYLKTLIATYQTIGDDDMYRIWKILKT